MIHARHRLVALLGTLLSCSLPAADPPPAASHGHAHNDYLHPRPLLDALDAGFASVEADVHLVNGALLVAHDLDQTRPESTLESLYLAPLRERAAAHGGVIHPGRSVFILLIDFKSEAESTYAALAPLLERHRAFLTRFTHNSTQTNAVTIVLSGNRPVATLARAPVRYAAIDGRLSDLDANPSPHLVPLISDRWPAHFQWTGEGDAPPSDLVGLRRAVSSAHRQNRWLRFWAIPDHSRSWSLMRREGVDLINTDNLQGLRELLTAPQP